MRTEKGLSSLPIILGIVIIVSGFIVAYQLGKSSPPSLTVNSNPSTTPQPKTSSSPTPTLSPSVSPVTKTSPTPSPASLNKINASFVCASADESYTQSNHLDLNFSAKIYGANTSDLLTVTLTDEKTHTTIITSSFGGNQPYSEFSFLAHESEMDQDRQIVPFVADGRKYTLRVYKVLNAASKTDSPKLSDLPKNAEAEQTISKICN